MSEQKSNKINTFDPLGLLESSGLSDYEIHIRESVESHSQHKISDLINILTSHMEKEGDLPLIYRGEDCACEFESFSDFCRTAKLGSTDKKVLMLGDFHFSGCSHLCHWLAPKYVKKSTQDENGQEHIN